MKRIILTGALANDSCARSGADRPGEGVHQDDPGVRPVRLRAGRCAALGEAAVRDGHADGCRPGGRVTAPPAVLPPQIRAEVRVPRRRHVLHPGGKGDVHGRRMHPGRRGLIPGLAAAAANVASYTPRISSVTVNDRHRADVNRFAILLDQRPAALPSTTVWQSRHSSVIVEFTQVTPWSLGGASWISYYPRYHVLSRDGVWFHAGASVDLLVRGQAARADGGDDNRGLGIAATAAVVLAAAAGAGRQVAQAEVRLIRGR